MSSIQQFQMYIDGQFVPSVTGAQFESLNPATGKPWALVPEAGIDDVNAAVNSARYAFDKGIWGKLTGTERARLLRKLGDIIARDAELLASCESKDNGKLYREMLGQWKYIPEWFYYYAGMADKLQGDTIPSDRNNFFIYTRREPIGLSLIHI